MTQEREMEEVRAMLVLCDSEFSSVGHGRPPSSSAELIEWSHRCRSLASSVQKWINAHARSLQPITVEGLVAMGATVGEKMSHQTKYLLKGIRIFVSVHGDMEWYYAEPYQSHLLQVCPAPENMLHVDELVERVGS